MSLEEILCLDVAREARLDGGKRRSGEHWFVCPHHADRNPSLRINEKKNSFYCDPCEEGGGAWKLAAWSIGRSPGDKADVTSWLREHGLIEAQVDGPDPRLKKSSKRLGAIEATYDYVDRDGELLYQVVRYKGKRFRQRRPVGNGGWAWNLEGVDPVLYRLPEVSKADEVFVVEGEKDADALFELGFTATTNPGGAGKWRDDYAPSKRRDLRVIVIPDNDDAGRAHAAQVATSLHGRVASLKIVELDVPERGDVSDWIAIRANGHAADELSRLVAEAREWSPEEREDEPFSVTLDEFIADRRDPPPPLLGEEDDCVLPACGLGLLVGKGGKGKTTLAVDLILHLASGAAWLGIAVPRPLRILLIENEGPREPFRRKLEQRRGLWPLEIRGSVRIYSRTWGAARVDDERFVRDLNSNCDEHEIDLIVGDPLDSLGMEGEGSPSETRRMIDLFKTAGLFSERAWLLPHHARKERVDDIVDAVSGAWGGRPDTLLVLEKLAGGRSRLTWAKVRWAKEDRQPWILGFDPDTQSFSFLHEEAGDERDLAAEIEEFLLEHPWSIATEIGAPKSTGGIGANRARVSETLEADPERFESRTGDAAMALGRRTGQAVVWRVCNPARGSEQGEHGSARGAKGNPAQGPLPYPTGRESLSGVAPEAGSPRSEHEAGSVDGLGRCRRCGSTFCRGCGEETDA